LLNIKNYYNIEKKLKAYHGLTEEELQSGKEDGILGE
jgi:hypothetical protein